MKLLVIGCKTMREGVVVSAVFLLGGLLLTLAAQHIVPAMLHMNRVVLFLGFVLLLLAPIGLVSTFLLTIMPGVKHDVDQCDH
jgi:hypothetical protein